MVSQRFVATIMVVLALGLMFSSAIARAGDDWSPLVTELRGIRQELGEIRRELQRRR